MSIQQDNPAGIIRALRNQPNGIAGLDANGDFVGRIINRVVTNADLSALVLEDGEIVYVPDTQSFVVGMEDRVGGVFLASPKIPLTYLNDGASITDGTEVMILEHPIKASLNYVVELMFRVIDSSGGNNFGFNSLPSSDPRLAAIPVIPLRKFGVIPGQNEIDLVGTLSPTGYWGTNMPPETIFGSGWLTIRNVVHSTTDTNYQAFIRQLATANALTFQAGLATIQRVS